MCSECQPENQVEREHQTVGQGPGEPEYRADDEANAEPAEETRGCAMESQFDANRYWSFSEAMSGEAGQTEGDPVDDPDTEPARKFTRDREDDCGREREYEPAGGLRDGVLQLPPCQIVSAASLE